MSLRHSHVNRSLLGATTTLALLVSSCVVLAGNSIVEQCYPAHHPAHGWTYSYPVQPHAQERPLRGSSAARTIPIVHNQADDTASPPTPSKPRIEVILEQLVDAISEASV